MKLYGIPNCNTVKKARSWLAERGIEVEFHDFRKHGVDEALLRHLLKQIPWEKLVNRQGTTWRQLPEEVKASVRDDATAIRLLLEKPSAIKRPILERDGKVLHLGFDESAYGSIFEERA